MVLENGSITWNRKEIKESIKEASKLSIRLTCLWHGDTLHHWDSYTTHYSWPQTFPQDTVTHMWDPATMTLSIVLRQPLWHATRRYQPVWTIYLWINCCLWGKQHRSKINCPWHMFRCETQATNTTNKLHTTKAHHAYQHTDQGRE